jgi:hypothetical protein
MEICCGILDKDTYFFLPYNFLFSQKKIDKTRITECSALKLGTNITI